MSIPSLSMPGLGLGSGLPSYGMAMRFTVSVEGLSLGHWSGCKNLKMDFKVTRLREGGNYGSDRIIPDQVVGSAVTLERAMEKTDSAAVQTWLAGVAEKWTSYSGTDEPYQGTTATITLFDVTGVPIASWTLGGVFPSSWSGPGLSASENKVAVETLVLEYQTITAGSAIAAPPVAPASLSDGKSPVTFPFSPEKISVSHTAKLEEITTGTATTASTGEMPFEDRLKAIGPTTIGLSGVTFDGKDVQARCNQLLKWTNAAKPQGSTVPELPLLTFQWGSSTVWKVKLMSADITYTRFSASGLPTRAQANLKCISQDDPLGPTNPSSGGLPGRRSHVVIAGESLQHIAMASYGRPGAWRTVAAANGIEDPLRVRPGAVVYLPGPEELTTGSPA
jgi:phage tail-like protein